MVSAPIPLIHPSLHPASALVNSSVFAYSVSYSTTLLLCCALALALSCSLTILLALSQEGTIEVVSEYASTRVGDWNIDGVRE